MAETKHASIYDAPRDGDVIQEALEAVRNHLGMEVAYFSEFVDGRSVFRRVDAPGLGDMITRGDSRSLDDVYCNHILAGRLPELIPDTSVEPLAVSMPITSAVPIGSHVSVPVRLADGTPFGMFCCLSPRANPSLNQRDLATMRVFADLAAKQVNAEIEERRLARSRRAVIQTIIAEDAFDIVFQPIVHLTRMHVTGYEALCRFRQLPYRTPDKCFADAAEVGLGVELELKTIAAAIRYLPRFPEGQKISVNASPETVTGGRLLEVLDPERLDRTILEITEHARVNDYDALQEALAPLRQRGLRVAVDDAGAGYSGLRHIVQLGPDMIKLDMSLTRGIDQDAARRALASAMIFYARETGSVVVAEGIETEAELLTLRLLGTTKGQGYLLGRPAPLESLLAPERKALAG